MAGLLLALPFILLSNVAESFAVGGEPGGDCVKSEIVTASGNGGAYLVDADDASSCSEQGAEAPAGGSMRGGCFGGHPFHADDLHSDSDRELLHGQR